MRGQYWLSRHFHYCCGIHEVQLSLNHQNSLVNSVTVLILQLAYGCGRKRRIIKYRPAAANLRRAEDRWVRIKDRNIYPDQELFHKFQVCVLGNSTIIEYGSTLYVGLQLKKNGRPHKAMVRTVSKSRKEAFLKLQKVSTCSLHYHEFL